LINVNRESVINGYYVCLTGCCVYLPWPINWQRPVLLSALNCALVFCKPGRRYERGAQCIVLAWDYFMALDFAQWYNISLPIIYGPYTQSV